MSPPWSTDRELGVEGVRRVISGQFPRFAGDSVEHIGSGWDYDAFLIDGEMVIRFPRRAEVAERLDREEALLDFVGSALGSSLRVPRITLRGEAGQHFPHRFFGHDHLPGTGGDDPGVPESPQLARQLGEALARIHTISPQAAAYAGIGLEEEGCAERLEETEGIVSGAEGLRELVADPVTWVELGPTLPSEYVDEPRFIHNDLCPDHVIVDRAEGHLVGIIDWSDAALGDPALDFVGLVHWRGWPFVESVLEHYGLATGNGFVERLDFLAKLLAVKWLANAIERASDVDKHVSWVWNSFEPGRRLGG